MVTIILAHPWHGSFNKALLDATVQGLVSSNKKYTVIDLNKDGFNPVFSEKELSLFAEGQSIDPLVKDYQEKLLNSDEVIFIFPIWWYDVPAILKGFFDKVFLKKFAYEETKWGLKGFLTNIKKVTIVTTSTSPTWALRYLFGNPIMGVMKTTLKGVGLKNIRWVNCGNVKETPAKNRQKILDILKDRRY